MPKRATKNPSKVFSRVLSNARKRLAIDADKAEALQHRGLRGDERAAALAEFLEGHLPSSFAVGKGEAIDYRDNRTGELDVIIYDRHTSAPIQESNSSVLVPAEALYAVIEVKSILTADEIGKCFEAAKKVRALRPFKQKFMPAAQAGEAFENHLRCPYYVFAYKTNLGSNDWAKKEMDRIDKKSTEMSIATNHIDRFLVLDRGIILPTSRSAMTEERSTDVFLEFYINLMNLLSREKSRRPAIDWMAYASRRGWERIS